MARPLRIEFAGAFYHVMARGNEKNTIYKDDNDCTKFLDYLEKASERYQARIHCYCLMGNHYHLLMETPRGNLAQIMRYINGSYSSYFNKRHQRVGHLFQGRYKSLLVDADAYCLTVSRYIHLNPVQDGLTQKPWDYKWSSCRDYVVNRSSSEWLMRSFILSFFGDDRGVEQQYRNYLTSDDSSDELRNSSFDSSILGQKQFVKQIYGKHVRKITASRDLPGLNEFKERSCIRTVIDATTKEVSGDARLSKKMSMYVCHRFCGYTLKEIGDVFGVGESAVSETSGRFALLLSSDQRLAETVASVLSELNL